MNPTSGSPLGPTWEGHVWTTTDALKLFEACLDGTLHHVPRRPHDRERSSLIRSGNVFIYEENASGIKRWTDGVPWSPSRILGNFLVYRELVKPFPPGEKKRAQKRPKGGRTSKPGEPYPRRPSNEEQQMSGKASKTDAVFECRDNERALIGSLIDSYGFKEGGLVKKTMSIIWNGVHHHLVSYYNIDEVLEGGMKTPSKDPALDYVKPRRELIALQNFRAPLDDPDPSAQDPVNAFSGTYDYGRGSYRTASLTDPLNQHNPHISQLAMGPYGAMHFSPSKIPPNLQSYAHIGQTTQPFFSATSTSAQPLPMKQESFVQFAAQYHSNSNGQLSVLQDPTAEHAPDQAVHSYRHRQDSTLNLPSRGNSIGSIPAMNDSKALDSTQWNRRHSAYSPMGAAFNAQAPYSGTPSWGLAATIPQTLPRTEDDWNALHSASQWTLSAGEGSPRQTNFQMPSSTG